MAGSRDCSAVVIAVTETANQRSIRRRPTVSRAGAGARRVGEAASSKSQTSSEGKATENGTNASKAAHRHEIKTLARNDEASAVEVAISRKVSTDRKAGSKLADRTDDAGRKVDSKRTREKRPTSSTAGRLVEMKVDSSENNADSNDSARAGATEADNGVMRANTTRASNTTSSTANKVLHAVPSRGILDSLIARCIEGKIPTTNASEAASARAADSNTVKETPVPSAETGPTDQITRTSSPARTDTTTTDPSETVESSAASAYRLVSLFYSDSRRSSQRREYWTVRHRIDTT